jgi:CubicO group peptidase (beta-lactamase class C family)
MIGGVVADGFEPVRAEFEANFSRRGELGAACAAYHRGSLVVDLWGGYRDPSRGAPWEEDTLVLVYSTSKGLAAITVAMAHSRGWLDFDAPVALYWPEFAQNGKERVTVRQLLAHQAGLCAID